MVDGYMRGFRILVSANDVLLCEPQQEFDGTVISERRVLSESQ